MKLTGLYSYFRSLNFSSIEVSGYCSLKQIFYCPTEAYIIFSYNLYRYDEDPQSLLIPVLFSVQNAGPSKCGSESSSPLESHRFSYTCCEDVSAPKTFRQQEE